MKKFSERPSANTWPAIRIFWPSSMPSGPSTRLATSIPRSAARASLPQSRFSKPLEAGGRSPHVVLSTRDFPQRRKPSHLRRHDDRSVTGIAVDDLPVAVGALDQIVEALDS